MPNTPNPHRCHVKLVGRSCEHELCYPIDRGVPPELRCDPTQPAGYASGGGGCCVVPEDMALQIERQLRDDLQECRRRGFVMVHAA
jgi:hypothetical protein